MYPTQENRSMSANRVNEFFLSLKGQSDGECAVVDVRKNLTHYDIFVCDVVATKLNYRPKTESGNFMYTGVYSPERDAPDLLLAMYLEMENACLPDAQKALYEYVTCVAEQDIYEYRVVSSDINDLVLIVLLQLDGPVACASMERLALLRDILVCSFSEVMDESLRAGNYVHEKVGLPKDYRPQARN
jgi:hypothetical protein